MAESSHDTESLAVAPGADEEEATEEVTLEGESMLSAGVPRWARHLARMKEGFKELRFARSAFQCELISSCINDV